MSRRSDRKKQTNTTKPDCFIYESLRRRRLLGLTRLKLDDRDNQAAEDPWNILAAMFNDYTVNVYQNASVLPPGPGQPTCGANRLVEIQHTKLLDLEGSYLVRK